jgi:hypothetical protein
MQFEPNIEKSLSLRNSIATDTPLLGGGDFSDFFEHKGLHGRFGHVI